MRLLHLVTIIWLFYIVQSEEPEEAEGVKYASKCEVCKILATELQEKLDKTAQNHDIIELG